MLFISSDLYIDAINLMLNDNDYTTKLLIETLLDIYEQDSKINSTIRSHITKFCISMLKDIIKNNITFDDKEDLLSHLLKYKNSVSLMKDETTYTILSKMINRERRLNKNKIDELKIKIQNSILYYNISNMSRNMIDLTNKCSIQSDPDKQQHFFNQIHSVAKDIVKEFETDRFNQCIDNLSVERIDLSSKDSIRKGIQNYKKVHTVGMPTGLKGLNRMFGRSGGPIRGESICINALMHQFKSGMLLSFARWLVKYNTPIIDGDKKPLILFISLENQADQNLIQLFKDAYEILYQRSSYDKTEDEIVDYVYEYFNSNGYTLIIERKLPNTFGYDELKTLLDRYREDYEIYACIIDYMNNMKKESSVSDKGGRPDLLLRMLYANVCNLTKNENITLITAHQLNRVAQQIVSSGVQNPVKKFNSDHLSDGMDPQREVDMVIYIHIEKHPLTGVSYLTMMCRKHRHVHDTADKYKYLAYPFSVYGLPDDLNTDEDYAVYDIYADTKTNFKPLGINELF